MTPKLPLMPGLLARPTAEPDVLIAWTVSALRCQRLLPGIKVLRPFQFVYRCRPSVS